jgi:HD domain
VAVQRIRQGVRALLAFGYPVDYGLAEQYLSARQMVLFCQMGRSEQLHSLNVLRSVLAQSAQTPSELAVGALLHDVGKGRYRLAVWQKTVAVLVKHLLPGLNARLAAHDTLTLWNAPFVVRQWHPRWSAELLAGADSAAAVVWLAEHHADAAEQWREHPDYPLLVRLQKADDEN